MESRLSPHPRYRLYTNGASYQAPLRRILNCLPNTSDAIDQLESSICVRFDIRSACCVPMARTGLFFGLQELIRPGQKVILSPLTIVDVVNMVILAGGIPVFADIRRQSCAIDPNQAESLIDSKTGAVLITHLHGESAGAHGFRDICRRRGVGTAGVKHLRYQTRLRFLKNLSCKSAAGIKNLRCQEIAALGTDRPRGRG